MLPTASEALYQNTIFNCHLMHATTHNNTLASLYKDSVSQMFFVLNSSHTVIYQRNWCLHILSNWRHKARLYWFLDRLYYFPVHWSLKKSQETSGKQKRKKKLIANFSKYFAFSCIFCLFFLLFLFVSTLWNGCGKDSRNNTSIKSDLI